MKRRPGLKLQLPPAICFRITRRCNADCRFCLAPRNESHPCATTLMGRIDWLLSHGVTGIHFCGGEPTMHPALPQLLTYAHTRGAKLKLTTNAIEMNDELLPALRNTGTQVKVSLHGSPEHHDHLVGREAFCHTSENLRRLIEARVPASVQTTVVGNSAWVVDWVADYCLRHGVKRMSILPFIPRGRGHEKRGIFALTRAERHALRNRVAGHRRALNGQLDVRWLDFATRPMHVLDADGRLLLEGMTESMDTLLRRIP